MMCGKLLVLLFVLCCLLTRESEGKSFGDQDDEGYPPYEGPIEVSAGGSSIRMTWSRAACVYGIVAMVLLLKEIRQGPNTLHGMWS